MKKSSVYGKITCKLGGNGLLLAQFKEVFTMSDAATKDEAEVKAMTKQDYEKKGLKIVGSTVIVKDRDLSRRKANAGIKKIDEILKSVKIEEDENSKSSD